MFSVSLRIYGLLFKLTTSAVVLLSTIHALLFSWLSKLRYFFWKKFTFASFFSQFIACEQAFGRAGEQGQISFRFRPKYREIFSCLPRLHIVKLILFPPFAEKLGGAVKSPGGAGTPDFK